VLTLTAATSSGAATATLTVTASGTGVSNQTAQLQLSVTQPVISLAATPATLAVSVGSNGTSTISIGRSTGYTGAVTLALDNPPSGIAGSFLPSPTTGNSSTVTLTVAGNVAPGPHTITVKGTAPGAADKTTTIALTVQASLPVGFSIGVDPVEFELPAGRGWSTHGVVTVTRANGFTGPVNVAVTPLGGSVGSIIGAAPSSIAANQVATNLLALAADGTPPGVYTANVRVTAPGFAEQNTQVRLRVSPPSTGSIQWKYCGASRVPRFFAVRDGNGAWRHIVPDGPAAATNATPATFSFSLTQSTAAVATVRLGESTSGSPLIQGFRWDVYYMTAQEITELAAQECITNPDATTRQLNGTLTGYQSFDAVVASASHRAIAFPGSTGPLSTTLSLLNVQPGPFDLFVTRSSFSNGAGAPIVAQQLILRRGLDPASGASLPALSFATDGVTPVTSVATFGNTNGETFSFISSFLTTTGLNALFHVSAPLTAISRAWYGVPGPGLQPTDLHQYVAATSNANARRAVIGYASQVSHQNVAFGPSLAPPSVTGGTGSTPPWIVRATGTLAPEYANRAALYLRETIADPRAMMIMASRGALGSGNGYDVAVPDLSAATGFTAFWNLRRGAGVRWTVTGGEGDPGSTEEVLCLQMGVCNVKPVAGAVYKSAQATGTVVVP